jgi:hypothetical protein
MIQGCNRSESYSGQKQPFSRKDKRNEHVRRVHKAPKRNGDGDLAYITRNDATSTPQTIEDTSMGPFTDTAWRSRAARLPELAPFHDAARLVGVTDLTGPGEFAGFTGVDISTRPLGPTSLYGPSTFSDAASIAGAADATAFTGFAGFANDSGSMAVTGFPSVDVSGWLSAGSEFTRLTGVDGSIANEGVPDVGGYAAVGTFTTDDEFGWFTSVSTFNEFGGIDISTDLNHETSAPHLNDALESIDSAM